MMIAATRNFDRPLAIGEVTAEHPADVCYPALLHGIVSGQRRDLGDTLLPAKTLRPIAVYLFVLALVALVPAFIFSAILLQRNNEAQERVVETLITGSSRSIWAAMPST